MSSSLGTESFPWRGLLPLGFAYFVVGTGSLCVVGMVPVISADLEVPPPDVAFLVTVFALAFALAAPLAQVLLHRFGRIRILCAGLVLLAVSSALGAAAPGYAALFISRLTLGLGAALVSPMCSALGATMTPPQSQGRAMAVVFGGLTISTVVGVPASAYLGALLGWRAVLLLIAALALIAMVLIVRLVDDRGQSTPATLRHLVDALTERRSGLAITTSFLQMAAGFTTYALIAPYLMLRFDVSIEAVSAYLLLYGLCGVLGNTLAGPLNDRFGAGKIIALSFSGTACGIIVLSLLGSSALLGAVGMGLWAIFGMMYHSPQQQRIANMSPRQSGLLLALNASALYLGMSAGSLLSQSVSVNFGYQWMPMASLAVLAAAGAAFWFSGRRPADG